MNNSKITINWLLAFLALFFLATNEKALAANFLTFNGDTSAEADWRTAAGTTVLEDFESYSVETQISKLEALGIEFNSLEGGGFPQIYDHPPNVTTTPYGSQHLGNFPNGTNAINRYDDIVLNVLPEYEITALGFWNGDGQADTLIATVYDVNNNILGEIGAFKGTFAGFTSDIPISKVIFDGNTGDGWNHLDGLQTNATAIPEPLTILGAATAIAFGTGFKRKLGKAKKK